MILRPVIAFLGLAVLAGCGAADSIKAPRAKECPSEVAAIGVKDILPTPPPGTEVIRSDPKGAKEVKDELRKADDTVRSIYSRVVAERGRVYGVGVYVANLDERVDPRAVVAGGKQGAADVNLEPEPITVAGEDGVIVVGPEMVGVTGTVGECSVLTLLGTKEAEVRAVAEKIRRAE